MSLTDTIADVQMKTMNAIHRTLLTVSGGRFGRTIGKMPVIELTTTGRKSGQPRTVMLTAPVHEPDRYVVVASKGGDDRDPDWYRNLVADPRVTIRPVGSDMGIAMTARTAAPAEKDELWPSIVASYDGYDGYAKKTTRDIPVVICEPTT